VCLDRLDNQAGMDFAWEQKKLEASLPKVVLAQGKMLENGDESRRPNARFVGRTACITRQ